MVFLPKLIFAQSKVAQTKIALVGRFHNNNIELRWIPDNKTIMKLGFNYSYIIERSDSGMNNFLPIGIAKTYSQLQWDSLLNNETNEETLKNLSIASDFLFATNTDKKNISLDEGIGELNEQKSKEELDYLVFVLTAIKDKKVAEALGLGFTDNTVISNKTYTYRVKFNGNSSIYEIESFPVTYIKVMNSSFI